MDKMIFTVGLVLVALGLGFLSIGAIDYNLSSAYTMGGYLWLVVGSVTSGIGLKVNRPKLQQIGAIR